MQPSVKSTTSLLDRGPQKKQGIPHVLVIHGGAGAMSKAGSTLEQRERYRVALRGALLAGHSVLEAGGEAIDAAVAAVSFMEDCPLFNSAKGAVFTSAGKNELESSVMLSKPPASRPDIPASRRGFSLSLLSRVRNPSQVARAMYLSPEETPHFMLAGEHVEKIAESLGQNIVEPSYYFTRNRWEEHRRGLGLPAEPYPNYPDNKEGDGAPVSLDQLPTGTVGAVALDRTGCIACCTSTGGKTNKLPGRIGDTPQMSAGFIAQEWGVKGPFRRAWRKVRGRAATRAVGVSGTGDGDYFIRQGTALTIAKRMEYLHEPLSKAAQAAVDDLAHDGGLGGVIAIDDQGRGRSFIQSQGCDSDFPIVICGYAIKLSRYVSRFGTRRRCPACRHFQRRCPRMSFSRSTLARPGA